MNYRFQSKLNRAERSSLAMLAVSALVITAVFGSFFAFSANTELFSPGLIIGVLLVAGGLWFVTGSWMYFRYMARLQLHPEGISLRFPYRLLKRELQADSAKIEWLGLVKGRRVWEISLLTRDQGWLHTQFLATEEAVERILQWAQNRRIATTHEPAAYLNQLEQYGIAHDLP